MNTSSTLPSSSTSSSSSSSSSPNVVFRLQGRNLFLTYPQCSVLPKDAEAALKPKLKHYEWSVWGSELHSDGSPHLHAFVRLAKPCDFRTSNCLDLVTPGGVVSHGNYQVARDAGSVLDYCVKGGQVESFNVDLADARAMFTSAGRKRTATELIIQELSEGKPMTKIAMDHPEHMTFIMLHNERLKAFYVQSVLEQEDPNRLTFVKAQTTFLEDTWTLEICQWLNQNLLQPRVRSQKQLFVWGPTCHGKTTLKEILAECLRMYTVPNEEFYDLYEDNRFDLACFDEYNHNKSITWMNQFVDGSTCPLRQKGHQTVKKQNLPVIVFSNKSLRENYPSVSEGIFATIQRRFHEVQLISPMKLQIIMKNGAGQESSISLPV